MPLSGPSFLYLYKEGVRPTQRKQWKQMWLSLCQVPGWQLRLTQGGVRGRRAVEESVSNLITALTWRWEKGWGPEIQVAL